MSIHSEFNPTDQLRRGLETHADLGGEGFVERILYGRPLPHSDLMSLGAELGSDVAFFLTGAALALGWGRGERLLALEPLSARPLLIVPPAAPVRTADAYAWIDKDRDAEHTGCGT